LIALIQRVTRAQVDISGQTVAAIDKGILALIGIEKDDNTDTGQRLLDRILTYRVFPDAAGRMNLDLSQIAGGLLLVPQFTLVADTARGTRPGFSHAAPPEVAAAVFEALCAAARARHTPVGAGTFGADMQVSLTNDGPVTFNLRVPPHKPELSGP
jgi:D-tyrosyl-tRNA(Tyr) deacylase